jgi:hypothetical protein
MADGMTGPLWEVCGASVRGALHVRNGLPNQDAIAWRTAFDDSGSALILVVSDGHGSKKSFRSDRGAQMAVRTGVDVLEEFARRLGPQRNLSEVGRVAELDLPRELVKRWQDAVEAHLVERPLAEDELQKLEPADRDVVMKDQSVVYGATLLGVLLTPRFLLYLQLGDGDIVAVADDGEVSRPLPPDERLFANETLSLCSPGSSGGRRLPSAGSAGAWTEFRIRFQPLEQRLPALILVSTDGYANSFRTDADFLKVGSDMLRMLRAEGTGPLRSGLATWLNDASAQCGDDVTLGLVYRAAAASWGPARAEDDILDAEPGATQPPAVDAGEGAGPGSREREDGEPGKGGRRRWLRLPAWLSGRGGHE